MVELSRTLKLLMCLEACLICLKIDDLVLGIEVMLLCLDCVLCE